MGYRAVTTQLIFLLGVLSAVGLLATAQSSLVDEMTTQERLQKNAWWPTKLSRGSEKYVGTAVCASCHAEIAKAQATAEMAQSLQQAGRALPLLTHFGQTISVDGFSYHLTGNADGAGFAVRVGNDTVSKPLVWAFGSGKLSQVYMTPEKDGFNESHFSWFDAVRGFDITPAQPALRVEASSVQGSGDALKRASGRTVAATEIRRCQWTRWISAGPATRPPWTCRCREYPVCRRYAFPHIGCKTAAAGATMRGLRARLAMTPIARWCTIVRPTTESAWRATCSRQRRW